MKISKYLCALAIAGACSPSLSAATLSFDLVEFGVKAVRLTVSGSISSLEGWTYVTTFYAFNPSIEPSRGTVASFGGGFADLYSMPSVAPFSIGSSSSAFNGSRDSGDTVGFQAKEGSESWLFLPQGYSAGTALNSSSEFYNNNFSSMGLTSGSYSWAAGPDTIQINVAPAAGGGTSAVPEASTSLGLLGLAAGGLLTRRRTSRKA